MASSLQADSLPFPQKGEAIVGAGALLDSNIKSLSLSGQKALTLTIIAVFPPKSAMATHDLVLLSADDARALLGLCDGFASDLCLSVFHADEQQAMLPDLRQAFPFPIHITSRKEAQGLFATGHLRRGGLALTALLPAVLALILLIIATARSGIGRNAEAGLLRCLGWTTRDLIRLQLCRSIFICLPAVTAGLVLAYGLTFAPGMQWAGYLFLGWQKSAPALYLSASGVIVSLLQIMAVVIIPYLSAALWPSLALSARDPQDMLEGELLQ
jgi:ABC-type lipoprotein release transport system permease subunit